MLATQQTTTVEGARALTKTECRVTAPAYTARRVRKTLGLALPVEWDPFDAVWRVRFFLGSIAFTETDLDEMKGFQL